MAILKKKSDTYNTYVMELSYGELMAFYEMTKESNGAMADELRDNLSWAFKRLPEPGVEEKDLKKVRDAAEKADKATEDAESDELKDLPSPDEGAEASTQKPVAPASSASAPREPLPTTPESDELPAP